jgi:SAM-dependent methyltransferase
MPTFEIARRALNSKAHYFPNLSVYDVGELGVTDFDVVLFCGVYYHLKDPLLALARLRRVMRPGAILVAEGEALDDERTSYARFFYRSEHAGDRSTWWVPTIGCLREWVECSYFEIVHLLNVAKDPLTGQPAEFAKKWLKRRLAWRGGATRCALTARAVLSDDPRYPYPDEELGHLSTK